VAEASLVSSLGATVHKFSVSQVTGKQQMKKIEEMSVSWVQQHVTVSKTLVAAAIAIGLLRHA